jgi:sodium transport system ATP-binding protein
LIEVISVSKAFAAQKGQVEALKNVSFSAVPGKIHALLGVNGAGKTTMMRIVCTLIRPDSGHVRIHGHDTVANPSEVRSKIGFMSASTSLHARLTPSEVLDTFAALNQMDLSLARSRKAELIDRLGIGDFKDRICDQLSTGQKQRVNIARAVLHDPPVVIFDEPTAGLDVLTSQTVLEFVEESRAAGRTVLYTTHIMSEVERLADAVTIIHEGHARGQGSPDELKAATGTSSLEKAFLSLVGYVASAGL